MKKSFFTLLFSAILASVFPSKIGAIVNQTKTEINQNSEKKALDFSKSGLEKSLGRKLSFGERIAVFLLKKKAKKYANKNNTNEGTPPPSSQGTGKNQIVAFILCLLLGLLGVHRFYLGYTFMGILYILTAGLGGIGWLIDLILLIIPNGLTPKGETRY